MNRWKPFLALAFLLTTLLFWCGQAAFCLSDWVPAPISNHSLQKPSLTPTFAVHSAAPVTMKSTLFDGWFAAADAVSRSA